MAPVYHEQSVFYLCKLSGAEAFPSCETWPAHNSWGWSTMMNYPIWDKRDLGFIAHVFSRLYRKVRAFWKTLLYR